MMPFPMTSPAQRAIRTLGSEFTYVQGLILHPFRNTRRSSKIFIVGSGRSGTHWLAHAFSVHPEVSITIEEPALLRLSVEMAQQPEREAELFPRLCRRYRAFHALASPKTYADKSHPNLWLAEKLAEAFPEARFLAIRRGVFPTVASMLVHAGTRRRAEEWDGSPNRLLGVSASFVETYRRLSIAARSAVRVIAHTTEIERLERTLGGRFLAVDYESLHRKAAGEQRKIQEFLALRSPISLPPADPTALDKWRSQLSQEDIDQIAAITRLLKSEKLLEAS